MMTIIAFAKQVGRQVASAAGSPLSVPGGR
jgi:hypothetical protein